MDVWLYVVFFHFQGMTSLFSQVFSVWTILEQACRQNFWGTATSPHPLLLCRRSSEKTTPPPPTSYMLHAQFLANEEFSSCLFTMHLSMLNLWGRWGGGGGIGGRFDVTSLPMLAMDFWSFVEFQGLGLSEEWGSLMPSWLIAILDDWERVKNSIIFWNYPEVIRSKPILCDSLNAVSERKVIESALIYFVRQRSSNLFNKVEM